MTLLNSVYVYTRNQVGKLHESDWSDFLFLKFYKIFGSVFSRCLHLWPGSLRACILNLNAFACKFVLFLALLLFENACCWCLPFVLWCFILFNPRNRQIGVAVFMLAKITVFCGVLSRVACTIAWCFICFLPWFLSLNTQLPSCLIFCSTFVYCLPDFLCRNPHFSLFCLLQVFLDVTSWVCAIFLYRFCFLLWSGLFSCILLVTTT